MTTTQLSPLLSRSPHPCQEKTTEHSCSYLWDLSSAKGMLRGSSQAWPQPDAPTVCAELFLGNALDLQILGAVICPSWCSQVTSLATKKTSQKNITRFLFFAPLSRWLLQIKAHVPTSLHKTLAFSFCSPRYALLPVFCHQQTTIQTNRSSTHLSGTWAYSPLHPPGKWVAITLRLIKRKFRQQWQQL